MPALLPDPDKGYRPGGALLPWVTRVAEQLVRGERIGLAERDRDEQLAILRAVVELVTTRARRRPCSRRRRAA
jgi:hypothetical protein